MRTLYVVVVALACAAPVLGQAQQRDDLQPGVDTSALPPPAATSSAPAAARSAESPAPAAGPAKATAPAAKSAKAGKASDRLDLDTTQITGNKELPKVMYVVPWKHSDLGRSHRQAGEQPGG